ncbi:MAG: caspase family protein [Gimesia chilikensis]|uniref:caspase family protein n=1 Tax=Gimesia chilikensis TaxID=2605989 RepID=UPI00378CB007
MSYKFESPITVSCCLLIVSLLGGLKTPPAEAGENYAFLVAVGDYDVKHLKPLAYTRNDILEFRTELLKSGFPKENIVLLHDDLKQLENRRYLPEAEKIRQEFTLLVSGLEPDDTLIVAMAGHGVQFKDGESSYFCPADADLDDEKHASLISFSELYRGLEQCEARKKLLLIDACRNNPQSQLSRSRAKVELQSITRPQSEPIPEGIVALFSCSAGEQAYEWPDLKHGIFFHHVLEGWKGAADDGDLSLSLDELVAYTRKKTQTFARLKLGSIQRPQRLGEFSGTWKLCEIEDPDYELGLKLYMGDGVLMDRGRAFQLFRKAADRGHTLAKTFVGLQYARGEYGVQSDLSEAKRWFESAMPALRTLAEEGNPLAQKQYGSMYGIRQDYDEAFKWTYKAAEQDDVISLHAMGMICEYGLGVEKSESIAVEWYRKAAEQGYAAAQHNLGLMYEKGLGVTINLKEAAKWHRLAADQNDVNAQHVLGVMYYNGRGVEQNNEEALKWFLKAAQQNFANSQFNIGIWYDNVKKYSEAVKWYQKAAEQNLAGAQNNLGTKYVLGEGVDKDYSKAMQWFRKAALQNHPLAQQSLGRMYNKGLGVKQNYYEAVKWYRKAADQNNATAQINLGFMYQYGLGVSKNINEAAALYRKAARSSDSSAAKIAVNNLKSLGYSP